MIKRCFFALVISLIFGVAQFAQTVAARPSTQIQQSPPAKVDPAKEAERVAKLALLTEQTLADVQGLRVGENRAFVYTKTGILACKSDKKSAQDMFQRAVNELGIAQMSAEAEEARRSNQRELRTVYMVRPTILGTIATCDSEFALDAMYRTRTTSIQKGLVALAEQATATTRLHDPTDINIQIARTELNLEQRLMRLAAEQNPERSAKLLQDTIRKGLSGETLSLLKKLFEKDPELAKSLADDVMDKVQSASFSSDPSDQTNTWLAFMILNDALRVPKPNVRELRFDEPDLRSLASKLINHAISNERNVLVRGPSLLQVIKIAEKYSPLSVAPLKKIERSNTRPGLATSEARRLSSANMTVPQLLAEAKKLPSESRPQAYQLAAGKMSQAGDYNGALELLSTNLSGRALDNAVNSLNWNYASQLMNQAKWSEAERLIDQFAETNRRTALISLAGKAYAKDPLENKPYAITVLAKVRSMIPDRPSDQFELTHLMQLAGVYAGIEPDEAFNAVDAVVPMLNDLADATAVVQAFQNTGNVRLGEFMIINNNNWGFQFEQNLLRSLAKADFERTTKLIDRFARREMRIALRLQLAESGLN